MKSLATAIFACFCIIANSTFAVTIMKNVGHGDCYVIVADGRLVVVDAGPPNNPNALVGLLKSGQLYFDRIVITHLHSDHAGGLITAAAYAKQKGQAFRVEALVSNRGEHDLDVILRESNLAAFLQSMKGTPIVGLSDKGAQRMAMNDPNLVVETYAFGEATKGNENRNGIFVKVTEIRDGERRAILFLGDLERPQQAALLERKDLAVIMRDVRAFTIPHHGRPTTLLPEFFAGLRAAADAPLLALHSDRMPLDRVVRGRATIAGVRVVSTASFSNRGKDVFVNLFEASTYHHVSGSATTVREYVSANVRQLAPTAHGTASADEFVAAVAAYANKTESETLAPGTTISLPSEEWMIGHVRASRKTFEQESDRLIQRLGSSREETVAAAATDLGARADRLTKVQIGRIASLVRKGGRTWTTDLGRPPDCPHKTMYRRTSARTYAADVLQKCPQSAVNAADRERAQMAEAKEWTETDPGWI